MARKAFTDAGLARDFLVLLIEALFNRRIETDTRSTAVVVSRFVIGSERAQRLPQISTNGSALMRKASSRKRMPCGSLRKSESTAAEPLTVAKSKAPFVKRTDFRV